MLFRSTAQKPAPRLGFAQSRGAGFWAVAERCCPAKRQPIQAARGPEHQPSGCLRAASRRLQRLTASGVERARKRGLGPNQGPRWTGNRGACLPRETPVGGRSRDRAGGPKGVQIPPAPVPHTPSPLERSPGAVALRLPRQAGFEPALGAWLCLVSLGLWLLSVPGAQVLAGPGGGPRAGGEPASERQRPTPAQVKSALLYNLVKYIQWPESAFGGPKEAFRIVVIGGDPLGAALDTAFEKKELPECWSKAD